MSILPAPVAPPLRDLWVMMPSPCSRCMAAGCSRIEATTEPFEVAWTRGSALARCAYACPSCAHRWADTWPVWGLFGLGDQGE